jgi:NADPH-dependent glutamate synthase beta subunit-like oxidoreductase
MGVTFHLKTAIGSDLEMNAVKASHQAVIVATGCPRYLRLDNPDESLAAIVHGLPFLKSVRCGQRPPVGRQVVVIGGGNAAVDAAQTALRLGAEQVTMVCLEAAHEVPAHPDAMAQAKAEGIQLECSWGSVEFLSRDGKLNGVVFQRCVQVFDDQACFCPQFDACEIKQIDCDMVIVAIGQTADQQVLDQMGLAADITAGVDPLTLQTSDPMVFMAGDVLSGPSSVIAAMAKGRQAAESAHRFLSAEHLRHGRVYAGPFETGFEINTDYGNGAERTPLPHGAFAGAGDFNEIEQCFDRATARKEAGRCYNCGVPFGKYRTCWFCLPCEVECPHDAMWVEIPYLLR